MNLTSLTEKLHKHSDRVEPINAKMKVVFEDGCIHVDGTGESNKVSNEDLPADCTIHIKWKDFEKLRQGKLNPMTAMMMGKIKIKGDIGLAMRLKDLLPS